MAPSPDAEPSRLHRPSYLPTIHYLCRILIPRLILSNLALVARIEPETRPLTNTLYDHSIGLNHSPRNHPSPPKLPSVCLRAFD
jgi:hypothetical protein